MRVDSGKHDCYIVEIVDDVAQGKPVAVFQVREVFSFTDHEGRIVFREYRHELNAWGKVREEVLKLKPGDNVHIIAELGSVQGRGGWRWNHTPKLTAIKVIRRQKPEEPF